MVEQLGLVTIAPVQPLLVALRIEQRKVIGIDLGNQQRHQRIHPVVAGVADDGPAAAREGDLGVAGDRRIQP